MSSEVFFNGSDSTVRNSAVFNLILFRLNTKRPPWFTRRKERAASL